MNIHEECPICYENYEKDNIRHTTVCGHSFHRSCVNKWIEEHNTCPCCRTEQGLIRPTFFPFRRRGFPFGQKVTITFYRAGHDPGLRYEINIVVNLPSHS